MSDRDLSPFFAPKSIAIVGAGERATSSGGAIMQMLRQAGYGGRVVPVNPKGGTIFDYESVTSIAAIGRLFRVSAPEAAAGGLDRRPTPARIALASPSRLRLRVPAVTTCPTCDSATVAALNAAAYDLTGDFHGCCIFATFCWTCGLSVATLGLSRAKAWGSDRGIGEFAVGLREIVLRSNGSGEG